MITYELHKKLYLIDSGQDIVCPNHIHQHIELIYVTKGMLTATVGDQLYHVPADHFLLILPNTLHSYHSDTPEEHIMLIFCPSLIRCHQTLFQKYCTNPILSNADLNVDVKNALFSLLHLFLPDNLGIVKGYLYVIFSHIIQCIELQDMPTTPQDDLVFQALTYINLNFIENISATTLAKSLDINTYTVSKLFNHHLHVSFSYYLNTLRIDYAKYLLRNTAYSITDIYCKCGYNSTHHFNRTFKTFTGISPKEYRANS